MKNPTPPNENEHPDELFLSYLDDELGPVERARLEEHVSSCDQCRAALDGLRETVATLRENTEAFCADTWELYEYVHYGHDPDGIISQHLNHCPSCRQSCESLRVEAPSEQSASWRMEKARDALPPVREASMRWGDRLQMFLARLYTGIRVPALAGGAVAAAVLALMVMYPWSVPPYYVAFSKVDWKEVPRPKVAPISSKRAAAVIVWEDFDSRPSQKEIDSFYRALAPTMEVYEHTSIVSPNALNRAAGWGRRSPGDRESLLRWLRAELDIQTPVLITISPGPQGRNVQIELVDTASGVVLARKTQEGQNEAELLPRVREAAMELFLAAGQPSHSDKKP